MYFYLGALILLLLYFVCRVVFRAWFDAKREHLSKLLEMDKEDPKISTGIIRRNPSRPETLP